MIIDNEEYYEQSTETVNYAEVVSGLSKSVFDTSTTG